MSKKSTHTAASGEGGSLCTAPSLGALLPKYILDLINEEEGAVVENHLLTCGDCRQRYLTVIRVRYEGRITRGKSEQNGQEVFSESEAVPEKNFSV